MCKFCDILYSLEINNRVLISIIFGIVYRRFSKDSKNSSYCTLPLVDSMQVFEVVLDQLL